MSVFRSAPDPYPPATMRRYAAARVAAMALFILVAIALAQSAAAQTFPALTGRVVDNGNVIDAATEKAMTDKLAAFEAAASDQIVVATIPSLDGAVLEDYANLLFRHWQLGQAQENNGVLLLVAVNDRKIRIEVGYGLEGVLTDLLAKLVIDNTMVPAFRAGDFSGGIDRAVDDIILILKGDGAELESRAQRFADRSNETEPSDRIISTIVILVFSLFFGMFIFSILARVFGRKIAPGKYKWLGLTVSTASGSGPRRSSGSSGSSWSSGSSGGFSGGGGSSGGGGASGGW